MSNEVTLPLAAAFADLAARRAGERQERPDPAAADAAPREDRLPFGALVKSEAAPTKNAERPDRRRHPQAERLMPGQLSKADKAAEAPDAERKPKPERSVDDEAPRKAKDRARADERPNAEARRDPENHTEDAPATEEAIETAEATKEQPSEIVATEEAATSEGEAAIAVDAAEGDATPALPVNPVPVVAAHPAKTGTAGLANASSIGAIEGEATASATDPALAAELAKLIQAQNAEEAGATKTDGTAGDAADALAAKKSATPGAGSATSDEVLAEAGKQAGDVTSPDAAKSAKTAEAAPSPAKPTQPELHPTRAPLFAEMLESIHGSSIHRPADILAGLDRSIGGSARAETASRPTPLQMLPIEIGMQAVRGATNFQIRLDPAELGRIDVRLQIKENGEVNANLVVDRVETLAMLRRDASTLQQAFEQAGLRQSADGLSFSLRGEGQNGEGRQESGRGGGRQDALDEAALNATPAEAAMRRVLIPNASIDRMI